MYRITTATLMVDIFFLASATRRKGEGWSSEELSGPQKFSFFSVLPYLPCTVLQFSQVVHSFKPFLDFKTATFNLKTIVLRIK